MFSALKYLEGLYRDLQEKSTSSHNPPLVIFFQEMLNSDLEQIQETDWIRQNFYVTDLSDDFWESGYYGTTTLVDKRLDVQRVFRVHYKNTRMQRDGLFVDVNVQPVNGMFYWFPCFIQIDVGRNKLSEFATMIFMSNLIYRR